MLWRCHRSLLCTRTHSLLPYLSFHSVSSPKVCHSYKVLKLNRENTNTNGHFPVKIKQELTPKLVLSVLRNCHSDLIALNFFLWCAKQKNYFHDAQTFGHMVGVVEKLTLRHKSVEGILRALESAGCDTKAQTFLLLLRIYWRGGAYDRVFEVYEEMGRFGYVPNTFACNVIMDVLFRIGRVDVALRVLKEMECPNFLSFNIALCNLCKVNDLVNIKDVIKVMLREGFHPNPETLKMILNCFCKLGRLPEAWQILCLMISLGTSVSVNIWSVLIQGFFRLREPEKANDLLKKMLKTGCSPNVVTHTILIKGFTDNGMVSRAFDVLSTMKSKGLSPDLVLCNLLIGLYTKIGRYNDALDVFARLPELKLAPDQHTFSSLLSNMCLSGRFSLFPLIADGLALEADLVVCNALLNYFCKAGFPSHAVKLYDDMICRGLQVDNYSFVGLLSGLCGTGKISEAVKVYLGLIRIEPDVDAYVHTVIISELMKVGELDKAICLFRRAISRKYPLDDVSYTLVIHGLIRTARVREAYSLYKEMKGVGITPNSRAYNVIISGFCEVRDVEVIGELLHEISTEQIELDLNTLISVGRILCNSHPRSSAHRQFCELKSRLIPSPLFDATRPDLKSFILKTVVTNADNDPFMDSSSSDDLSDVAAAAG